MLGEEVAAPGYDDVNQKLEVMMKMLTDLPRRVKATEDQLREVWASPTVSPSTSRNESQVPVVPQPGASLVRRDAPPGRKENETAASLHRGHYQG